MKVGLPVQREIPVGSKWKENDRRSTRIVEVLGYDDSGKVMIKTLSTGRRTFANPNRFNGRHGGYTRIDQ